MSQDTTDLNPTDSPDWTGHREWCFLDGQCYSDNESVMHQSITSSVAADNNGVGRVLDVTTTQYVGFDSAGDVVSSTPQPQVWLRQHKTDGVDLTITEARQLAQALQNHADVAEGTFGPGPVDRAATLIVSMLAHTGRNPNELHDALVRWIDVMVDAMAAAR